MNQRKQSKNTKPQHELLSNLNRNQLFALGQIFQSQISKENKKVVETDANQSNCLNQSLELPILKSPSGN